MSSRRKTDSDLSSVSSGLSSVPDGDGATVNGKSSRASKVKASKPAPVKKTKVYSVEPAKGEKAASTKTKAGADSGRPEKAMSKPKANGKGKAKAVVKEIQRVEKRQRTYGLLSHDLIQYAEDEDIKSDWQVPYVWAFIVKFCRDAIKGLGIVDDFERGLMSMGPHDGIAEVLAALLKGVQGYNPAGKPKNEPNPDELALAVKKLLDNRLRPGSPLTVFDSYVYEVKSYVPKDQGDASGSAHKESDLYRDLEETDIMEDRRNRNPLAEHGFWAVPWQARLKVLRQLVDWTLTTKGPIREALDAIYAPKKNRPVATDYSCDIEGLKDGNKRYIYRVDSSYRVYAANKMYHMGTPLNTLTSTKAEYESLIAEYKESQRTLDQLKKSGKKSAVERRNAENNIRLGERLEEDLPKIEEAEAEIVRAKERYEKAQLRKLRALAQLEASSFALTTRSRTRKVVNYNESQLDNDFEEEVQEYPSRGLGRSSTGSSFQTGNTRAAKREFQELDSTNDDQDFAPDELEDVAIRPFKRSRRFEHMEESSVAQSDPGSNEEESKATVEATETEPMDMQSEVEIQTEKNDAGERQELGLDGAASPVTRQTILA